MTKDELIRGLNEDLAAELGTIKLKLEEIAADEAGHARMLQRLLKGM